MASPALQKVADSVLLLLAARVAMVVMLPLGWLYFEARVFTPLEQAITRIERSETHYQELATRVSAIEVSRSIGQAAWSTFQSSTHSRLDRMESTIVTLSNTISALNATIQAMRERGNIKRDSAIDRNG